MTKRFLFVADDFGLSEPVNEAVERAHREGVLDAASLMVAGDAADDAIQRARRMPGLQVGLHLVAVEGRAMLPPAQIPALADADGWISADQRRLGVAYAFSVAARAQLAAEVAAQFAAFDATGLPLAHVDAHKHMHMSPYVATLLARHARARGTPRIRIPHEPVHILRAAGAPAGLAARAMAAWSAHIRRSLAPHGLPMTDHCFGIAWSGAMTEARLLRLIAAAPPSHNEIYLHPATTSDPLLRRLMPSYDHAGELAALLSPRVRAALPSSPA